MQTIKTSAFFNLDFLCIPLKITEKQKVGCFIRISKILLYAIHNCQIRIAAIIKPTNPLIINIIASFIPNSRL